MSEDEIRNILEDMEKHGFPLEVRTSQIFKAHKCEVNNQVAYSDLEKGKHRTIDMVAEKNILDNKLTLDLWFVIECKKSKNPWVFYGSNFDVKEEEYGRKFVSSMQFHQDLGVHHKKEDYSVLSALESFLLGKRLSPSIFAKIAYAAFEPHTDGKGRNIHKAQMQLSNAIIDLKRVLNESYIKRISPYGILFVPLIVFDGHLYLWENEKLAPIEGLYYYMSAYGHSFMIEVVRNDFLENYLENIEANIRTFNIP